ncbi:unnamed protein product [Pseudo-nitzschia multistriata]|uniref:Fructose-bisphosphate aldolase n=1 Tax=Pseudo-nitzschia multistriata TaxID=183589 RepID=A0A448ZIW5_9STRA|nr:unnamed protein product [Pseudo-nitzschia multistriata]
MQMRFQNQTFGALCPLLAFLLPNDSMSLSAEVAQFNRAQIQQALSSPSGKLTFSPEIVVPEARDPTAILLQGPAITQLSTNIRSRAKANVAFVTSDALGTFRTFCKEQEEARGNFPGPVPIIYCGAENDETKRIVEDLPEIADTGVAGVLVSINGGSEISSMGDISGDDSEPSSWLKICKNAIECGLQPIPEVVVKDSTAALWKEEEMEALVDKLSELMGEDPVSIVLTINPTSSEEDSEATDLPLPSISKSVGKRVSIMKSVQTAAGGGQLGEATRLIKASGFTGAFLRRECVPGFPASPNVEFSSDFWSACIGDLKSTRSKTFNFRSKNNMETQLATQWANYQQDVMDSGALGDMSDGPPPGFDAEGGDYQGF